MSRRSTRINYKSFNSTGERVPVEEQDCLSRLQNLSITEQPSTEMTEPSEHAIDMMVLAQEAMDMKQEVPINNLSPEDSNIVITKLEQIRSSIRRKETIIRCRKEVLSEDVKLSVNQAVTSIRDFISASYDRKSKINLSKMQIKDKEAATRKSKIIFLLDCIDREIDNLETIFAQNISQADSHDLILWRTNLPTTTQQFDKIKESYKECLDTPIMDADTLMMIRKAGQRYVDLDGHKQIFTLDLTKEISKRELDKLSDFKKKSLNIKLEKFSGYDGVIDFFTFKANFEKMFDSSTPSHLLPDLLKNNYLAGPALEIIK